MSIPNIPQIIGAAVQGALHDTQAALARMGQGIQQAPPFDPSAAAQGQENTGQNPLGLIGQRLAQEAQAQARGVTTLPFVGQVHYGALPLPLRVPAQAGATLDDLAGMTGELLQNAGRTAAGTYAAANAAARLVGQQGPLSGLPGGAQDPTSQAHAEVGQAPQLLHTFLQSGPIAAEQQAQQFAQQNGNGLDPEGLAGALASTLPGQEAALPAELAANAPRLAALVDALNAASKASVKPFQLAPALHPLEATGIPALRRTLAQGDAAAAELGAPLQIAGSGATPPGPTPTGPPNPLNLPATVTRRADYNQAARALGVPQLRPLPEEPSPLTLRSFSPFLAARQLAARQAQEQAATAATALPKPVQPISALVNAAQQTAKPNPLEQLLGAAQGVAARDVTPKPTLAQIEAAVPKAAEAPAQLALPDLPTAPESGAQRQIRANVDNSPAPLSAVANSPLAALRDLMLSGDGGRGMVYPPLDPAFYTKRLGIPAQDVPALLDQLVQEGTLGHDHTGALTVKAPDTGIPPEAITPEQEAAAARFDYPADQPLQQTPMPDFPGYGGQDRAAILRALPAKQIDTLLNLAYGPDEAVANALTKYPDPADLVDAALQRITTDRAKVARLSQTDPQLAQTIAFLPDAAEQGAPASLPHVDNPSIPLIQHAPAAPLPDSTPQGGLFGDFFASLLNEEENRAARYANAPRQVTDPAIDRFMAGSVVKKPNGDPLVVYHGTTASGFTEMQPGTNNTWGAGIYFTDNPQAAAGYALGGRADGVLPGAMQDGANIIPAYVNIKRPAVIDGANPQGVGPADLAHLGGAAKYFGDPAAFTAALQREGYDGIKVTLGGKQTYYIPFDSTQIKSAIGNRGTYNPLDPSLIGIVHPAFNTPPAIALGNAVGTAASHLAGKPAAVKAMLADAADAQRTANASSNGLFPGGLGGIVPALRVAKKTAALVPLRNLIGNGVNVAAAGKVTPAAYLADVSQMFDRMPQYLAALKAANALTGQARGAAQERAFLTILPDQWQGLRQQFGDDAIMGVLHKLGEDYQRFDQQAANIPWQQGAMRGALFDMLGPGAFTGPVGLATGAVRGALLPARARLQTDLLTPIDKGARLSVAYRALTDALAHGATIDQAGDAAGAAAKHALGDYTTRSRGMAAFDTLAPGARWNLEQGKILGRVVGDHPGLAVAAAIAAANGDAPRPDLADPRHTMTLQFDDRTPGLGLAARALNGGATGQVNVNPLYPFSPIGGDLLNVAYDIAHPERHPLENPIQQALDLLDAGGVSVNPLLAALLHKGGIVGQGPSNPDRLAKAGEAGDVLLRGWLEANTPQGSKLRLAGYIPTLANLFASSSEQNPDATDILAGRVHDPTVDKAVNELVFEQTGKPLMDPSNRAYVAQTFDPNSPLMRQAKVRGGMQLAAQALSSNFAPGPVDGTTATAHQAAVAQEALVAAGLAPEQIKQMEVATGNPLVDVQAQMLADMASAGLPAVRIYADLSMKERGQLLLNFWEHEHDFANAVAPGVTGAYRQQEQQRLGLVPAGTLAQQVQGYDLAAQGLTPGNGPLVRPPYLQGLNLDTLFPHPGQPAATPYTPYLLPPGAGRP